MPKCMIWWMLGVLGAVMIGAQTLAAEGQAGAVSPTTLPVADAEAVRVPINLQEWVRPRWATTASIVREGRDGQACVKVVTTVRDWNQQIKYQLFYPRAVAKVVNQLHNRVTIAGHNSASVGKGTSDDWALSSARANASRDRARLSEPARPR